MTENSWRVKGGEVFKSLIVHWQNCVCGEHSPRLPDAYNNNSKKYKEDLREFSNLRRFCFPGICSACFNIHTVS